MTPRPAAAGYSRHKPVNATASRPPRMAACRRPALALSRNVMLRPPQESPGGAGSGGAWIIGSGNRTHSNQNAMAAGWTGAAKPNGRAVNKLHRNCRALDGAPQPNARTSGSSAAHRPVSPGICRCGRPANGFPGTRGRSEAGLAQHRLHRFRRFRDDDVRLLAGQAKRWREAEYVALRHGAADHTAFGKCSGDLRSDLSGRVEELAVVAILDEFHGRQHALSAHLADMLVIGNGSGKLAAEIGAGLAGIPYKVELVNELEIGNACGRAD